MRPLLIAVCLACTLACAALATVLAQSGERPAPRPCTTWNAYLGGAHSAQFTALDQITAANVSRLQVAWTFPAGNRTFLFNPLAADGLVYVLAGANNLVALDAATGTQVWSRPHPGAVGDPRPELLAERRRARPPAALHRGRNADRRRRAYRSGGRAVPPERPRPTSAACQRRAGRWTASPRCRRPTPDGSSMTSSSSAFRHRPLATTRILATSTRTTCAAARCNGCSTRCPRPAKRAPTRGRQAPAPRTAASTTGAN